MEWFYQTLSFRIKETHSYFIMKSIISVTLRRRLNQSKINIIVLFILFFARKFFWNSANEFSILWRKSQLISSILRLVSFVFLIRSQYASFLLLSSALSKSFCVFKKLSYFSEFSSSSSTNITRRDGNKSWFSWFPDSILFFDSSREALILESTCCMRYILRVLAYS